MQRKRAALKSLRRNRHIRRRHRCQRNLQARDPRCCSSEGPNITNGPKLVGFQAGRAPFSPIMPVPWVLGNRARNPSPRLRKSRRSHRIRQWLDAASGLAGREGTFHRQPRIPSRQCDTAPGGPGRSRPRHRHRSRKHTSRRQDRGPKPRNEQAGAAAGLEASNAKVRPHRTSATSTPSSPCASVRASPPWASLIRRRTSFCESA